MEDDTLVDVKWKLWGRGDVLEGSWFCVHGSLGEVVSAHWGVTDSVVYWFIVGLRMNSR